MAIILTGQTEAPAEPLPRAEVDLPRPDSAPAATPALSAADLARLAQSDQVLLRSFVAERIVRSVDPKAMTELALQLLGDKDARIRSMVLEVAAELGGAALEPVSAILKNEGGSLAGAAARALGRLDGARLLADIKARARLDDAAYGPALSALAILDGADAGDYLDKSMNRAGALTPERRAGLYSAVLLSGRTELAARVIGAAVSDSRGEEPPDGVFPTRIALGALAGIEVGLAAKSAGETLWKELAGTDPEARAWAEPLDRRGLEQGIRHRDPKVLLAALAGALDRAAPSDATPEQIGVLRRRQGSLRALINQAASIATLEPASTAIFAAAALSAAELIIVASDRAEQSPAVATMSKLMNVEPSALPGLSEADWVARFTAEGERKMRQVAGVLSSEALNNAALVERILSAIVQAGGGAVLIDTASTTKRQAFAGAALKALVSFPAQAEPAARAVLEQRPLEAAPTRVALAIAARIATQQLGLVIGRRFYEIREVARFPLIDAVVQLGDARLLPLLESRAFAEEPEELAWVVLSMIAGAKLEGKLAAALARIMAPEQDDRPEQPKIELPLRCKHCKEVLSYAFRRVYVDPKGEGQDGDPAYVGDVRCKACGQEDQLEPTPQSTELMSAHMMEYLIARRSGMTPDQLPLVVPRTMRVRGKEVGLAKALREAEEELKASPGSLRAHLRRGRLRLMLWRSGTSADADAVLAADPRSPEAFMLRGSSRAQGGDYAGAVTDIAAGLELLRADDEPRVYEGEKKELLIDAEEGLLELEVLGADLPPNLDLSDARQRRRRRAEAEAAEMEAMQRAAMEEAGGAATPRRERPAFLK
ncbi:MAG: hypothetical protein U1E65_28195 [Myxococcota bacterium]